ncbi:membrane protein [Longimycelium tulufanense]|uniref:Membrane protein n=1 Tax=Longimycelium tulufanense TaxID=907463 RepID=A0A8J3CA43_9PSEU|nr:tetratricopeptide repeat protein [Longimycelium tulufanense]GGM38334.1 membrane protein [Longimycelium tulufanense]
MNATRRLLSPRNVALLLVAVLVVYFLLTARRAVVLLGTGTPVGIALGLTVLVLPLIGVWIVVANVRFGMRTERLARQLATEGGMPDTSGLPRLPSGRVNRDAADAWFAERRAEVEAEPGDWRRWYRLAMAYDLAGDRGRAREAMRKALELAEPDLS